MHLVSGPSKILCMYRQAIQYVNLIRVWTQNDVSFPIFPSPRLHSSVFLLDDFSLMLPLLCVFPHLFSYQLPHHGHGATEGGRMVGKLLKYHTRMAPSWHRLCLANSTEAAKAEAPEIKNNESVNLRLYSSRLGF